MSWWYDVGWAFFLHWTGHMGPYHLRTWILHLGIFLHVVSHLSLLKFSTIWMGDFRHWFTNFIFSTVLWISLCSHFWEHSSFCLSAIQLNWWGLLYFKFLRFPYVLMILSVKDHALTHECNVLSYNFFLSLWAY